MGGDGLGKVQMTKPADGVETPLCSELLLTQNYFDLKERLTFARHT